MPGMTIADRLRAAGCVFADDEARLIVDAAHNASDLEAMVEQRVSGVPLQHVVGWADFCGVRITVHPGVFVPRVRTEFLVHEAVRLLTSRPANPVVLDLCCGSGAIGVAVHDMHEAVELHAADVDPIAVRCARCNVEPRGGRTYEGDLYQPLPSGLKGRVDVILANVPYVPTGEIPLMPREARDHEPHTALDGGADGLDVARRVVDGAPQWLRPGGHVLFEIGEQQVGAATEVVRSGGLLPSVMRSADGGSTVMIATNPSVRRTEKVW